VGGDEFFSEGIFANGDRFHIANHGSVQVEGESSSALIGVGADGLIVNFGIVNSLASESFVIGAVGDRFLVANHGSVQVDGALFSDGLIGAGADGVVINFGRVWSVSLDSHVIVAEGERSQVINVGQVAANGPSSTALWVEGEDASALNLGQILVAGFGGRGMFGGFDNTDLTNRGVIDITAENGLGMIGSPHMSNFGLIATRAFSASGIAGGANAEIVNAGRIATEGNFSLGIELGFPWLATPVLVDGEIVNRGVIETRGDGAAGVGMFGAAHHLANSGRITTDGAIFTQHLVGLDLSLSAAGVVVSGNEALVENTRRGVIRSKDAASAAVELNVAELLLGPPAADTSSTLDNFGRISGAAVAVLGGAGQETVVNHGRIEGDVILGGGDDTFVAGKGGSVAGDLILGDGDDVVIIESRSGTTRIEDFAAGDLNGDVINVSAFFSSFNQLATHMSQQGGDVVISLDHKDTLALANLQLSSLNADDFSFA
jgi:hypothetical protein